MQKKSPKFVFVTILLIFIVVGIILISNSDNPNESIIKRSVSSSTLSSEESLTVTLTIDVINSETYYALEEYIPSGAIITNDGGGLTSNLSRLAWVVISDAADTTYTYTMTAPASTGTHNFGGVYQFETGTLTETKGDTTVEVV